MSDRVVISGVDVTADGVEAWELCPDCHGIVDKYPWWDDPPEAGGAVIGDYLVCRACDWTDSR